MAVSYIATNILIICLLISKKCDKIYKSNIMENDVMKLLYVVENLNMGINQLHAVELAIGLKQENVEIIIASEGGMLERKLSLADIVHIDVPFSKSKDMAVFNIMKIIKSHKVDVVHSFDCETMKLCAIACKLTKTKFVSSVFDVPENAPRSLFGSRIFSMGMQTTKALLELGIVEQDIIEVCDAMSDELPDYSELKSVMDAAGLEREKRRIVHYSNLDEKNSVVAHALIEGAVELKRTDPDIEIVIAGKGRDFEALSAKATTQNARAGEKVVKLVGASYELDALVALSDVYVGASRGAIYAAKYKKPIVVADGKGYEGSADLESIERLMDLNFMSDNKVSFSRTRLLSDLKTILLMDAKQKKEIIEKTYALAQEKYSQEKLKEKVLKTYKNLKDFGEDYFDVVLSGYYGHKNSGDDALLSAIIKEIKEAKDDARFVVLSANPVETKNVYGVHAVNRFNPLAVYNAIKKTKLFINGGGSLIQDVTSSKSLYYYLTAIKTAFKLKKKTMLYANGIGPVYKKKNKPMVKKVLNQVDYITLRDERSVEVLKSMGVTEPPITVTSDPSVSIAPNGIERVKEIFKNERIDLKPYFVISIREWKNKNIASEVAKAADYISKTYGLTPVFIPMQNPNDISISIDCIKQMSQKGYMIKGDYSFTDVMTIASKATLVIGMRLHLLMYGANVAVPVIGLVYDPKITAYLDYLQQNFTIDTRMVTSKKICDMADEIFADYKSISDALDIKVKMLKDLSKENARIAVKLIEGEEV